MHCQRNIGSALECLACTWKCVDITVECVLPEKKITDVKSSTVVLYS